MNLKQYDYDQIYDRRGDHSLAVKNGLHGIIDKLYRVVIPLKYAFITHLSERRAVFRFPDSEKYGVVSICNRTIVQPKYDFISSFYSGHAFVILKDKLGVERLGVIDTEGKEIVSPQYEVIDWTFKINHVHHIYDFKSLLFINDKNNITFNRFKKRDIAHVIIEVLKHKLKY